MVAPWIGASASAFPAQSVGLEIRWYNAVGPYSCGVSFFSGSSTGYIEGAVLPARTAGATGITRGISSSVATNLTIVSWLNDAGTEVLRLRTTATGVVQLQRWDGSAFVAVGTSVTIPNNNLRNWVVEFSGLGTSSGSLRLWMLDAVSSAVVKDETTAGLNLTAVSNIAQMRIYVVSANTVPTSVFSGAFVKDGTGVTTYGYNRAPNANGTDVDGTGTPTASYTAIDDTDTGTPDADFVSLSASSQRRSVKCAARTFGGRPVKLVGFDFRARCGATGPTQVKAYLRIGATRYYWGGGSGTPITLTTVFANYQAYWDQDPSTAAPWDAANAESANLEYGLEVV